ncbi:NADH-quinone oxidoreductase subunit J family protein [Spirosoma luteum]|uniref:NADH-quinone oxidoreductase subunit J family protein n=1 Tax=Spirosoma luteum TaxID=431553 RepID=UPI001B7FCBF4|nr:NADH-quinone oxidoreductase subunit J [Spirosoma luteum]
MERIIFLLLFGSTAIWFAWRVFMTKSMIRSALSLLASMVAIGILFLVMQAEFLGVLHIMMMATEMTIMAIFMMMFMMDPGGMGDMDMSHQKKYSSVFAFLSGASYAAAILFTQWPITADAVPAPAQQNHDLGIELMQRSMMIFETAGVSILVAMIAATATALSFNSVNK